MLGWMNTPPQDTLEKSISALNARVKELEETVRLRDEKLALEAETIALNHEAERGRCVMALGELPDAVLAGDVYHDAVVRVWEVLNGVSTKIFEEAMDRAQKARSRAWQLFADSRKAERERDELREKLADRDREYSRALGVVGRLQEEGVRARQELDELKVKLAEVGEVLEGVWAKVVFTDTTLRKKVRALLKRGE
jgi:peptidoglycan hydrolase CwlO-like protein